jgi:hypothetical protein
MWEICCETERRNYVALITLVLCGKDSSKHHGKCTHSTLLKKVNLSKVNPRSISDVFRSRAFRPEMTFDCVLSSQRGEIKRKRRSCRKCSNLRNHAMHRTSKLIVRHANCKHNAIFPHFACFLARTRPRGCLCLIDAIVEWISAQGYQISEILSVVSLNFSIHL